MNTIRTVIAIPRTIAAPRPSASRGGERCGTELTGIRQANGSRKAASKRRGEGASDRWDGKQSGARGGTRGETTIARRDGVTDRKSGT